ncbi:MAG TPA: lipoyl(octanoyl) transferase LipB [Kiritimatiellia bacterium]|nr:lipoyl(octanoyl) transferase LipB [Kiritimatiellia bacterium]HRZ12646.1 lipoyl(octanoyl) transferase LipB [Kiritimatiellia bacterium]HSA19586.1 lipoyl(octanoyl) transferase LipB [Kiritimatiellia bacterium]
MSARAFFLELPLPFSEGVELQERLVEARARGDIPDTVLFLEHAPVVTLGARGRTEHLKLSRDELAARGIELAPASRGGDVTYHGPGQLVMYPILKLGEREADAHGYLFNLEEVGLRTAADFGVQAWRRPGLNGIWTEAGKLAAIGFRIRRWVTMHGMSFNVDPDLGGFQAIFPCGLREPVTSLRALLGGRCPALSAVRDRMAVHFGAVFQRPLAVRGGNPMP